MAETKSISKKHLLIGAGILIALVLAYLFFSKGDDQKTRDGAVTDNDNGSNTPTGGYADAYNHTDTVANERNGGIVPVSVGGDGARQKTKLATKTEFDNKVRAVIGQILAEGEEGEWFQMILADINEHWSGVAGQPIDKAIYLTARTYIAGNYYY